MSATDTLKQAPATAMRDEEKDRQIEEVLAMLAKESPAWTLTHGQFMKLIDRPKGRQRSN